MTKAPNRLPSITVPIVLGRVEAEPENGIKGNEGRHLEISIAHEWQDLLTGEYGPIREVVFVGRGKIGQGLDLMLNELSIKLSRAIQSRDHETGEDL